MEKFKTPLIAFTAAISMTVLAIVISSLLYQPKKMVKRGYEIAISKDGKAVKKEVKIVDLATLMQTADLDKGAKKAKKCASCHSFNKGGKAKVGPNLYKIIGKKRGSSPGFAYSKAMKAKGGVWTRESINEFIKKPKEYLPGTKMGFAGLKKPQDRANIILFLEESSK
jgi:cytochrome c